MKKLTGFKKVFTAMFLAVVIFLMPSAVMAEETYVGIEPLAVTACANGNGVHDMRSSGMGSVYVNGRLSFSGPCYQCQNCYHVTVSEYDPGGFDGWLGTYATYDPGFKISGNGCIMDVTHTQYYYSDTKPLPGYRFDYVIGFPK